jgi:heat shock protein HslJ
MKIKWISGLVLLSLLLAACAGATTPEPTVTSEPTATVELVLPTSTAEPATPTATQEPSPTPPSVVQPPAIADSDVLATSQFAVAAPATVAETVTWEQLPGSPYDTNQPAGLNGLPPHLLVTFDNEVVDTVNFRPDQRQGRILPLDDYLAMYSTINVPMIAEEAQKLEELLAQPDPDLSGPLPWLPPVNAAQILTARGHIVEFEGGEGIAYLASFSQGILPITSQNLLYLFIGLSTDGSQLVSFVHPVASSLLPASLDSVPQEIDDALAADPQQYYANTADLLDSGIPADFTPDLDELDAMFGSIQINTPPGSAVTPPPTSPPVPTATATTQVVLPAPTPTATAIYSGVDILGNWYWISLNPGAGSAVAPGDPDRYIVTFNASGALGARGDCNTASGAFRIGTQRRLSIDLTGGTDENCGADSLYDTFFAYLEEAASYSIDGNTLTLNLQDGGTMRFTR